MAGNASILEDHSLLSKLDKNLLKIEKAFALISGLAIFSLMVLAVRSVGGREFFEWPLSGYVDWIMQLMPLIAILAVSFAMRDGTHIRMDIFVSQLSGRLLWTFELSPMFGHFPNRTTSAETKADYVWPFSKRITFGLLLVIFKTDYFWSF